MNVERGADPEVVLRPFARSDFAAAVELVSAARLPTDDLAPDRFAIVAERDGVLAGVIGLERYGKVGLLRSLAVAPAARGAGIAARLVHGLEAHAAREGVTRLWLLTIDADGWFSRLDYRCESRERAPAAITTTAEFSSLCPADAVLMSKRLAR